MGSRAVLPPGPPFPAAVQTALWLGWPVGFVAWCGRRYGDVFTLRLAFGPPTVMVADPAQAERVLALPPEIAGAGEENAVLAPLLGRHSVLMLDGAEHLRHRRLLLPWFHGERMRAQAGPIAALVRAEMGRWPLGRPFPLLPRMRAVTFEVILRVVFGLAESDRLPELRRLLDRLLRLGTSWLMLPWLQRDLGAFTPWGRFLRLRARVGALLAEEVAERRRPPRAGAGDLVGALLGGLSDEEVVDELVTLLVAGHETTATSLAWCFEMLLRRPELVARTRDELAAGRTRLVDAAVRETLRVRPVFRLLSRRLRQPIDLGGRTLPAGVAVGANVLLAHRRLGGAADPAAFVPERWLEPSPPVRGYVPFGGGVRRCVGAGFAPFEMGIVLAEVLNGARLRPASPRPERVRLHAVAMVPGRGARVVMEERLRPGIT